MRLNKAGADNRPCFIFKYFSKLSSHSDTRSYQAVTPLLLFASIFPTASPSHPDVQFPLLPSPRNRQNQFKLPGNHCPLYLTYVIYELSYLQSWILSLFQGTDHTD